MQKNLRPSSAFFGLLILLGHANSSISAQSLPITIKYNPTLNTLNATYTGCDICALGTVTEVEACNCTKSCLGQENNPCSKQCTPGAYYNWCIYECCKSKCGNVFAERTPVAFAYRMIATWDIIPFDPIANVNNYQVFTSSTITIPTNGGIVIPPWTVPAPWPGIYVGNNTCYQFRLTILYSDNTICTFTSLWDCNLVG